MALVPDTLDLHENATLVINALTRCTNPDDSSVNYFYGSATRNPPVMFWADGLTSKFPEGLSLMRYLTGSSFNTQVDRRWREYYSELFQKDSIGLNLSPLMAKYVSNGDILAWSEIAAKLIDTVVETIDRPLYLIPHVTVSGNNDYEFMKTAYSRLNHKKKVVMIPPKYSAAEIKGIIGKMSCFTGARTHSTIAGLSMGVPTLSVSYSAKSIGINRDIFGNDDYIVKALDLTPDRFIKKLSDLIESRDDISRILKISIIKQMEMAKKGGEHLKKLIDK